MARRKPVPIPGHEDQQIHNEHTQQQTAADSHIRRYTLTDGPTTPTSMKTFSSEQDSISQAVHKLLNRHSAGADPELRSNADERDDASPQGKSLERESPGSGFTVRILQARNGGSEDDHENREEPLQQQLPQRAQSVPPYQHGQLLPTIVTGETLNLDEFGEEVSNGTHDPFTDGQALPRIPLPTTQPYVNYDEGYSDASPLPEYPSSGYHYVPPQDPNEMYQYAESEPLPAGFIDHFQHDAEAYASGNFSRAAYRPPRSRSPTPAVDDEDYHIVGNDSVHYTNFPHPPGMQGWDVEKEMYGGPYDQGGYLNEKYADAFGQDLAYPHVDDTKKTPVSTLNYLEPEAPVETRHFGPAPTGRVVRRHKSKKRVQLTNGNLVVDINVPPKMVLPYRGEPEMTKTRYTAVTCDPDEFEKSGFFLRQNENGRRTELFIVITMYNEDEVLFCRTMDGVMRNITHLCSRKNSQTWGSDAWKKVVVCIVADGRKKTHARVLDCLTLLGVYQPGGHMKNMVNNKQVTAHLFEYTTSFGLDPNLHFKYPDTGIVPTQIILCIKEKNQKKINSHRWFFNAFAPMLQPNVCVLLDVGTRPGKNSIYRLWKAFDANSNVGGACGEIAAYKGKNWKYLLNPLVAAQNFEYKMSNILDKPTESLFGYIGVLPGAFSAYRYIALQNDKNNQGPLASYFKGEVLHGRDTDIFTSNMYLAEDRILCFELVAKTNSNWILKYVKGAIGETDVPDALPEFISQRRRWLNGSFFASAYAIAHIGQIMRSGQSLGRKITLMFETVYTIINMVFAWFSIGNFFLFFVILTSSVEDPSFHMPGIKYFNSIVQYFMASMIVACFLFSMGNKPASAKLKYKLTSIFFAVLMLYLIFCSIKCAAAAASQGGSTGRVMVLSFLVTYGVYICSSVIAFDAWHMITSFGPYLLLSPTYVNILSIYALSNLDDISWGTKQDTTVETDLGAVIQDSHAEVDVEMFTEAADVNSLYEEALVNLKNRKPLPTKGNGLLTNSEREQNAKDYYANVRTNVLLAWVLSNGMLLAGILSGGSTSETFNPNTQLNRTKAYMVFILVFMAITSIIRFIGSTTYLLTYLITG